MANEHAETLGPLAALVGVWEGDKGGDLAPASDRGIDNNLYRERLTLEPIGQVDNHEQTLYGLRYATMAWRIGADDPFHEEVGYWLYEPKTSLVMRCFIVPRGISIVAGGTAAADATSFSLEAKLGSQTFGICANPFLDREFKTERYDLNVTVHDDGSWAYEEHTWMRMPGRDQLFDHSDANTLHPAS